MVKKIKFKPQSGSDKKTEAVPSGPIISRRGKITMAAGIALAAVGYYILTLTDPAGRNWASSLCPFLILGGYAVIGVGIILPGADEASAALPPTVPDLKK